MASSATRLEGIRGWLLIVGLYVILAPLLQLTNLIQLKDALVTIIQADEASGSFTVLLLVEVVFGCFFLVWACLNALLFFERKSAFPSCWVSFLWASWIFFLVDLVAVDHVAGLPITPEEAGQAFGRFLASVGWSLYIFRSDRVKNTFLSGRTDKAFWTGRVKTASILLFVSVPVATAAFFLFGLPGNVHETITTREIASTAKASFVSIAGYYDGEKVSSGSGFVVNSDGVIVTNAHVLEGANSLEVELPNGEVYTRVSIVNMDNRRDLALLRIPTSGLPALSLGDARALEVGDPLYALGNPLGLNFSFTDGILSARRVFEGIEHLQISVPISEGSSGGPVLNTAGQVVGVVTAYVPGGQNLNIAMPSHYLHGMLDTTSQPQLFEELAASGTFSGSQSVAARREELDELLASLPAASRSELDDMSPWMVETFVRAVFIASAFEDEGWQRVEVGAQIDLLAEGERDYFDLELDSGTYILYGTCDNDCTDLDLAALIPGSDSVFDEGLDAEPLVRFEISEHMAINAQVSMHSCATEQCMYSVSVFRK